MDDCLLGLAAGVFRVRPDDLRPLYGGHAASVFEFQRDGRFYVLRILPPAAQVARAQIAAAQAWMAYLADHGVPVPRALPTVDGDWVATVGLEGSSYLVVAMDRAEGIRAELLPPERWDDTLFAAIGSMVGRMHAVAMGYEPPAGMRCAAWDQGTNLFYAPDLRAGEAAWLAPEADEIMGALRTLPKTRESYGLAHLDLHFANFLIDQDSGTFSVIDFDDCGYGWYLMDTAVLLFDVLVLYRGEDRAAFVERFMRAYLEGYREHKRLDGAWLLKLPLFLKLLEINVYGAVLPYYDPSAEETDSWVAAFMSGRRERLAGRELYVDYDFARLAGGA